MLSQVKYAQLCHFGKNYSFNFAIFSILYSSQLSILAETTNLVAKMQYELALCFLF